MARLATQLMLGKTLKDLALGPQHIPHFGVKESVFPFAMYPEVDPVLGPEMRSTGEVLGMADSFGLAFFKAQEAAKPALPTSGTVLISVAEKSREVADVGREFARLGFQIKATRGTHDFLAHHGVVSELVHKRHEGRPDITDEIMNRQVQLVINTPAGRKSQTDDSYIRKAAIKYKVPYVTTVAAALASAKGIAATKTGLGGVTSLQGYHRHIRPAAH
jgi:carbamoyl-phosphate synthase large subunit